LAISATVGGATDRALLPDFKSYTAQFCLCLCIVLLLVLSEFAGFVMAFLRLHKILAYLEATAESRCVVEGEEVLCAKLLILCGVTKVVETRHEIFGLCLQTSALTSAPHEIKGQLSVKDNNVEVDNFSCTFYV
jgi:hypothetical protein